MISGKPQDATELNNDRQIQQIKLALKESESQFRSFVENSFDVIFILDAHGIFRFVSPSWEQHFGYPASEVIGKPFAPFAHPDDVQPCFNYLTEVMTTGQPGSSPKYRVKCTDGTWKLFIANGSRFTDSYGETLFHGIGRDITVQEQILDQLKSSEERYRAIVNTQYEFLNRFIPGGVLTFVNDAFCRSVGLPREELLGRSFLPFVQEDDRTTLIRSLAALTPENPSLTTIDRLVYPDGNLRWQNWTSTAIFDTDGKIVEYQAVGRDITEQKNNLDALDYANECFNQALSGAEHILYRLNMKTGSYDYLSPAFERITGYPVTAFKINGLENLRKLVHPEDSNVINIVDDALRNRTGNRVNIHYEFRLQKADGNYCWLNDYTTACFNDHGELECFFGSAYDLTSRKEVESALRQAHTGLELRVSERTAELAAANEQIKLMSFQLIRAEELERGRIAAELHDQVGQSLLLAKMNLDLLANDISTKKERRTAANIATLLSSSIDDIRTLTFGLRLPLLETAGLEAALQWLCAKFYDDFNLQIDFSCRSKPPQISSEKRYSLFQAIRELLLNVAKHGRVGHAQLSLGTVAGELTVAIIDKGIGFEPSAYRQKLATVASFGIFNVQQRIKQLGGDFEIVSAPGKGTTAWIRIPLDKEMS